MDWTSQVIILDGLIADYDAEISEMDARRLKLVADRTKTIGVRRALLDDSLVPL
jgi:hypothetical protein